jgi:hypothetical protein
LFVCAESFQQINKKRNKQNSQLAVRSLPPLRSGGFAPSGPAKVAPPPPISPESKRNCQPHAICWKCTDAISQMLRPVAAFNVSTAGCWGRSRTSEHRGGATVRKDWRVNRHAGVGLIWRLEPIVQS